MPVKNNLAPWQQLAANKAEYGKVKYNDPRLDEFAGVVEGRYGLPKGLLVAIKNAGERSNTGQVSGAGAKGVMQFIDSTRKAYDHDPSNPFASIDASGRYFKDLMVKYKGNVKAAVTEYNGGVKQARAVEKGEEPTAAETVNYLARIKAYMAERAGSGGATK